MSKSKSSSVTKPAKVWEEQAPYLTDLYQNAQNLYNQPAQNATQLMGQQSGLDYATSGGLSNLVNQSQNALSMTLSPQQNPYLGQAIQAATRPITQNYQENVLGGITDGAVQAGQTGGTRQGVAEGIAARDYMNKIGDVSSQMSYAGYNDNMNRLLQGLGQSSNIANLGMLPGTLQYGIGSQQNQAPWQQAAKYQSLIGGPTVLSGGGNSSSSSFSLPIGDIAGAAYLFG